MLIAGFSAAFALLIIWLGYPLVMFLLARSRSGARSLQDSTAAVSVILATYHDVKTVRARITNILSSSAGTHDMEVIVALDAARAQSTPEDFRDFDPRVRVIIGDAPGGKAAALNAAVRLARYGILVFADTAQHFAPLAISELVAELADPRRGAVSGQLVIDRSDRQIGLAERYWLLERSLRKWEARVHSAIGVTGAIYAMRRELWSPLPTGLILDDLYVPMRLLLNGWRIGFTDRARAVDARSFAPHEEYRRKVRTLTGVIQLCAWLPDVLNPMRNPVWLPFVFHKLLRLLTPYLFLIVAAAMLWRVPAVVARTSGLWFSVGGILLVVSLLIPRLRRRVGSIASAIVALQAATVVAFVNGIRGRWDVWR